MGWDGDKDGIRMGRDKDGTGHDKDVMEWDGIRMRRDRDGIGWNRVFPRCAQVCKIVKICADSLACQDTRQGGYAPWFTGAVKAGLG